MRRFLISGLYMLSGLLTTLNLFSQSTYRFASDTLKSQLHLCDTSQNTSYFKLLNIVVDSEFVLIDSTKHRINEDSLFDYVFVLSNKIQEGDVLGTDCNRKHNSRLLLLFVSSNEGYAKPVINENAVLNSFEYQSDPFRKISSLESGFKLSFYVGTRIRYYYDFYFKLSKDGTCFLYRSKSSSYDIHRSDSDKSQNKYYQCSKRTNLEAVNIRDFLKYYR